MQDKNIIQFHKGYEFLCPFERVCLERWKWLNPNWNHMFLTNEEADVHVKEYLEGHWETYESLGVGQKGDITRAVLLHKFGGLYIDCDQYPVKPIEKHIREGETLALFKYAGRNLVHTNPVYAVRGNSYFLTYLDTAIHLCETTEPIDDTADKYKGWVFDTTGAHCWTRVAHSLGLEPSYEGSDWHIKDVESRKDQVFTLHYHAESWVPDPRWETKEHRLHDEMRYLNNIKAIFGI